jgi:uncharacterized protein (DUF3820 family)
MRELYLNYFRAGFPGGKFMTAMSLIEGVTA